MNLIATRCTDVAVTFELDDVPRGIDAAEEFQKIFTPGKLDIDGAEITVTTDYREGEDGDTPTDTLTVHITLPAQPPRQWDDIRQAVTINVDEAEAFNWASLADVDITSGSAS